MSQLAIQSDIELVSRVQIPVAFKELFEAFRYKVFWGGRGPGKSWAYADALLISMLEQPLRTLCARELQVSIADSVHRLICDRIQALGLDEFWHITNTSIRSTINDSEFLFKGLRHNATEIKSLEGIDRVWVEEAEKVSDASWEVLIPTIRKKGSEIWISFNAKNPTDATYRRFILEGREDSIVKKVSWRDNPFFPEVLEKERLALQKYDPEAYAHIWEGEFDTRYSGAVYAKWIAALYEKDPPQINDLVQHDPEFPVYTSWDLGYDDSTAIWFCQLGYGELFWIDYYENNGEGIGHYCDVLKGELKGFDGIIDPEHVHRKNYQYADHYVPHDAANKVMAAGGKSIMEQALRDHGVRMTVIPATSQMNSIEALRKTLPKSWFSKTRCAVGIDALMQYAFQYDEKLGTFKSIPIHNFASHGCDAGELIARMWTAKTMTNKELEKKEAVSKFHRLRQELKMDNVDPYRIKPWKKRK